MCLYHIVHNILKHPTFLIVKRTSNSTSNRMKLCGSATDFELMWAEYLPLVIDDCSCSKTDYGNDGIVLKLVIQHKDSW